MELSNLISAAVAARMTPEFIEKEIDTRVAKLIVESVDLALRSYSDTGKLIQQAIADALRVQSLDLPSYGNTVSAILKAQIEAKVAPLIAGRLAADMDELLNLAPKEVKLSAIADDMRARHDDDPCGPIITVIVERSVYGNAWLYLDEDHVYDVGDKYRCEARLLIGSDGVIASATLNEKDIKSTQHLGRAYGLAQQIRSWFACGTTIILDDESVVTSVGDY